MNAEIISPRRPAVGYGLGSSPGVHTAFRRAVGQRLVLAFLFWAVLTLGYLELEGGGGRAQPLQPATMTRDAPTMRIDEVDYAAIVRGMMVLDGMVDTCR